MRCPGTARHGKRSSPGRKYQSRAHGILGAGPPGSEDSGVRLTAARGCPVPGRRPGATQRSDRRANPPPARSAPPRRVIVHRRPSPRLGAPVDATQGVASAAQRRHRCPCPSRPLRAWRIRALRTATRRYRRRPAPARRRTGENAGGISIPRAGTVQVAHLRMADLREVIARGAGAPRLRAEPRARTAARHPRLRHRQHAATGLAQPEQPLDGGVGADARRRPRAVVRRRGAYRRARHPGRGDRQREPARRHRIAPLQRVGAAVARRPAQHATPRRAEVLVRSSVRPTSSASWPRSSSAIGRTPAGASRAHSTSAPASTPATMPRPPMRSTGVAWNSCAPDRHRGHAKDEHASLPKARRAA